MLIYTAGDDNMIWECAAPRRAKRSIDDDNYIYLLSKENRKILRVKLSFEKDKVIEAMKELMSFKTQKDIQIVSKKRLEAYDLPDCINAIFIGNNNSEKSYIIPSDDFQNFFFYSLNNIFNNNCYITNDIFDKLNDAYLLFKYNGSTYNLNISDCEQKIKIIEELISNIKIEKDVVCDYESIENAVRLIDEVAWYEGLPFDCDKFKTLISRAVLNVEKFHDLNIDINKSKEKTYKK